ncbi:MAG: bifunctional proline dehydrogenase/L-glutamate gamma-semialdehyde dehydrogenase PutA [Alphaproteobacteria bacterium]|nr:bifunctional proline dehydrogenase/L-glutamate gamma-semialdehyde dehydrogenase PutA [Alphaproteobacteria bacterium]
MGEVMTRFNSADHYKKLDLLFRADEDKCLHDLFDAATLSKEQRLNAADRATRWIEEIRRTYKPGMGVSDMLAQFGLSSQEGIALMCLAEALLRIPDNTTANALIRDKLAETEWNNAIGTGGSWAIGAAGWALTLTGKVLGLDNPAHQTPGAVLGKLVSRAGQPVIREALSFAMKFLAGQFVMGEAISAALTRAEPQMAQGVRFSFDMLGEGARSAEDAERYYKDYVYAIDAVGAHQIAHHFPRTSGISVKLSALHPRYEYPQRDRVLKELLPRLVALCEKAAAVNIPLTIDAEETERLQLSLELIEQVFEKAQLGTWTGLGFAVQAYQKRAPEVLDFLINLARHHKRRVHIRLVKGAYWDAEIKRAQERGWNDFPLFTRKASTDVSYLACARKMVTATDAIDPVFGTHNAMTVAHIVSLSGKPDKLEFQRLHGMGEELHALMMRDQLATCIYAPVGNHEVLLGYLVRRILENGANSSFVHRLLDKAVPVSELTTDAVEEVKKQVQYRHPLVKLPDDLYQPERRNARGYDITDPFVTGGMMNSIQQVNLTSYAAHGIVNGTPVVPKDSPSSVPYAFAAAQKAQKSWGQKPVAERAACLDRLADILESRDAEILGLLVKEGGKILADAVAELREAVDFCRYYAARARVDFEPVTLPGPTGEHNELRLAGRGVFVCISPWNFPLAIYLGQIAAALVAGNAVVAKPAPQTPRIATYTAELIHRAGVPTDIFHLLTGGAEVGRAIVAHPAVSGVAFTGSTMAAQHINRTLAARTDKIVPLIAETGGQNAMIVDSTALPEQVIDDVITSAFRSAGQRCSALRVLCLPDSTADKILAMLKGAMAELRVGDPSDLATDIGPVIDRDAHDRLQAHIVRLRNEAKEIASTPVSASLDGWHFVAPQAWEIPAINWLTGEVFGPILHVIRYKPQALDSVIEQINATGFGLTGGLHSRIQETVDHVAQNLHVGNFYVNRSTIGAVVGVQPFGGEGASGTGPKAGGPHYLQRFATERVVSVNTTAAGGNASLLLAASQ